MRKYRSMGLNVLSKTRLIHQSAPLTLPSGDPIRNHVASGPYSVMRPSVRLYEGKEREKSNVDLYTKPHFILPYIVSIKMYEWDMITCL